MVQARFKIAYNRKISDHYFCLGIDAGRLVKSCCPGQFFEIKIGGTDDPLLRRPFSIHKISGKYIEALIEIVGKATRIISNKKAGEYLDVIGPLGNGFSFVGTGHGLSVTNHQSPILVAGGMGVAPLVFLAEKLSHSPQPTAHRKITVLLGAKTKSCILCEKEFKALGCEVKIATDDGSKGFKGRVTDLLKNILLPAGYPALYACGPKPMLKAVSVISREYNISAQLSLEAHMACGIGACLGCVVNTTQGFKRVCKEGPVFSVDEIVW